MEFSSRPFSDMYTLCLWSPLHSIQQRFFMSCLQNEMILEDLFSEVCEEFPNMSEDRQIEITKQRFEDLCQ